MAGLFLVRAEDPDYAAAALAGARAQFARHGFTGISERQLPGWNLVHAPHIIGGPESLLVEGPDLVAVAGTFTCDGLMGRPALQALLDSWSGAPDWSRLGGQFVALVHKDGRTWLFTDYFAAFQLFHDSDWRFFSTSMLSAVRALPRVTFDAQGVYELAFNAVALGNDTIFEQLKLLGPEQMVELHHGGRNLVALSKPLPEASEEMPVGERIERHKALVALVVGQHVHPYGDRVFCPLSGGLDSRLVLAALRAESCHPSVYVYGSPGSADVRIAQTIGEALGFAVDWVDKEAYRQVEPGAFPELVERNFEQYDALPNFGDLFENGANIAALHARHDGGALSASGGCGEIYRNFFFLPDRPARAEVVARSFFARFKASDATSAFDPESFLRAIEDKILSALGVPGDRSKLPRALIEQTYPRVRCRSLFGKEISVEGRHGAYLMPFLDHRLVAAGMALPMRLKNAGVFESMLLAALDPDLARQPSAYGHDFASPPNMKHRFTEWSTRVRPAWVRQHSYALQRKLGPMADEHGGLLTREYMSRVVDLDYPAMRRFFVPERITDSGLLRRVACLEYFAGYLGSKLGN